MIPALTIVATASSTPEPHSPTGSTPPITPTSMPPPLPRGAPRADRAGAPHPPRPPPADHTDLDAPVLDSHALDGAFRCAHAGPDVTAFQCGTGRAGHRGDSSAVD